MNPISNTAYYCCGVRMEDAKKRRSICNDTYAERFMDENGRKIFLPFKDEKMTNITNITRCRLIDDYLLAELSENNQVAILTIGAGFDSRPYRLAGGNWLEIDEPQIIQYKNEKLPVEECPNPLRRIPMDFSHESLTEKLKEESTGEHTVIVIEGVIMHLKPEAIETTIMAIQRLYPKHVLYCDLMTRKFMTRFAQRVHSKILATGGTLLVQHDSPEEIFVQHNYKEMERIPMLKRAGELGILREEMRIPKFVNWLMLNVLAKDLNGYAVHCFCFEKS